MYEPKIKLSDLQVLRTNHITSCTSVISLVTHKPIVHYFVCKFHVFHVKNVTLIYYYEHLVSASRRHIIDSKKSFIGQYNGLKGTQSISHIFIIAQHPVQPFCLIILQRLFPEGHFLPAEVA